MKPTMRVLVAAAAAFAAWRLARHLDERMQRRAGRSTERSRAQEGRSYRRAIARWENEGGATLSKREIGASAAE